MIRQAALACIAALAFAHPAAAQQQGQQQLPDPARMSRQDLQNEVTTSRAILGNGGVRTNRPAGCASAEQRQFDFWLGEWDVSSTGTSVVIAESTISVHDQGCMILEYWRPFRGAHGHSINAYDATDQNWHQMWVDATGRRTMYRGAFRDGVLYLDNVSAPQGARTRMNYQRIDENTVRQWGENFDAATNSWTVAWDLTYRRRAGTR